LTDGVQEIATMLYGEIRPSGNFRFVNFGHPPPLVYSAEFARFVELDKSRMVQFLPLGLQIPEDHPDRNRYLSLDYRKPRVKSSDVAELTLMNTGDIFFLYTDGVYSGGDKEERSRLEKVMLEHHQLSAKEICNALLDYALKRDDELRQRGEQDRIDDKTVFIIKRH
jgi:serine phosphatase RsbU (regulator of sigma subunit)